MTMSFFLIFSEHLWDKLHANLPHLQFFANNFVYSSHTDIKLCTVDTRRSLFLKFFIWPINSGVLTSLLLPHPSSSLTDSLPSLNLLCHSKTDARFMQDSPKAVWSIPYVSMAFFPSLKHNFIAYRSSKVSSRPDCIFEIHQLWQSGFCRMYSNCCCSRWFEAEIIKIGLSSHKIYNNNILDFQKFPTILNACTKSLETYWRYLVYVWKCPWCNGYSHEKWTRWHEFKSWTRLIIFHIALGKGLNPIILPPAIDK